MRLCLSQSSGPSLEGLVDSTLLGGSSIERWRWIDVDSAGNAYIAGYTLINNSLQH